MTHVSLGLANMTDPLYFWPGWPPYPHSWLGASQVQVPWVWKTYPPHVYLDLASMSNPCYFGLSWPPSPSVLGLINMLNSCSVSLTHFLFHHYFFYRSFVFFIFNFVLQLQFLICLVFFHFNPHSFNFLLCFSSFLVSVILNPSLFFVGVSESIVFVLIFYFGSFLFCASFICLQFSHSILICVYYIFQFSYSTFDFFFISLLFFFKILIVFNFTLQIKFIFFSIVIIFLNLIIIIIIIIIIITITTLQMKFMVFFQ